MRIVGLVGSVASVRRKLRAVAAISADPAATEHEKSNAQTLKARLERRLKEAGSPAGDWTDTAFRLGRRVKELKKSVSPEEPNGNWTENAFRLGKGLGA